MVLAEDLRLSVLQSAIEGKLTEQLFTDTPVNNTLVELKQIKDDLISAKTIKPTKPCVNEDEPPFSIPDNWAWVKLTDIGELSRGKSKHRPRNDAMLYVDGTIPLIQTGDVASADKHITKFSTCYNEVGLAQSRLWKKGTLCITIAANIGDVAILDFDACFPDSVLGFLPYSDSVSVEYVYFMLLAYKSRMNQKASKVAQSNLSLDKIGTMLFPLPPKEEQKRIAEKLEIVMQQIDEYKVDEQHLFMIKKQFPVDMRYAILQAAFQGEITGGVDSDTPVAAILKAHKIKIVDSDRDCPPSWEWTKLKYVTTLENGQKKTGNPHVYLEARYLRTLQNSEIRNDGNFITAGTDVILVDGENSGEVFTVPEDGYMGSTFKILKINECMNRRFILYLLMLYQNYFKNSKKGEAIPHLNKTLFKDLLIAIPSIEEQQRIVERLDALLPLCDTLMD